MALTIVDKELVQLFKAMYRVENKGGFSSGKFTTMVNECFEMIDQKKIV
jgi:hypothetical protein